MKKICICLATLGLLYSCKQARVATTTHHEGFFKEPVSNTFTNTSTNPAGVYTEFKELSIPMDVPNNDYPDWQSFRDLLAQKQAALSANGQEYGAQLLLNGYQLYRQPYTATLATEITTQLNQLVTARHKGYGLLYSCMEWLQRNGATTTVAGLKTKVLAYARPVLGAPNPNLPDSPEIVNNPGLKADMDRVVARVKENDGYIEKIRGL